MFEKLNNVVLYVKIIILLVGLGTCHISKGVKTSNLRTQENVMQIVQKRINNYISGGMKYFYLEQTLNCTCIVLFHLNHNLLN